MRKELQLYSAAVLGLIIGGAVSVAQPIEIVRANLTSVQSISGTAPITTAGTTTVVISCTPASSGVGGCLTNTTQTISGAKTLDTVLTSSVAANASAYGCTNNGCRFSIGTGSTYWTSDGTILSTPATTLTNTVGDITATLGSFYDYNAGLANLTAFYAASGSFDSNAASGNKSLNVRNAGALVKVGPGANDYWTQDPNGNISTPSYVVSATPFTLASVYVNNTVAAFQYGGRDLPARAFTVTGLGYSIRAAGSGGTTNNTFAVTGSGASTGVCNCTFACNAAAGNYLSTCTNGTGVGCVFAASTDLSFSFTTVGNCTTPTDILGDMQIEGNWQ
jgi:hypothetical protein